MHHWKILNLKMIPALIIISWWNYFPCVPFSAVLNAKLVSLPGWHLSCEYLTKSVTLWVILSANPLGPMGGNLCTCFCWNTHIFIWFSSAYNWVGFVPVTLVRLEHISPGMLLKSVWRLSQGCDLTYAGEFCIWIHRTRCIMFKFYMRFSPLDL